MKEIRCKQPGLIFNNNGKPSFKIIFEDDKFYPVADEVADFLLKDKPALFEEKKAKTKTKKETKEEAQ